MINKEIYSLWIKGELSDVNLLTIRSVQSFRHELIIYSYDDSITKECEVRDAREILPENEVYFYKNMMGGNPNFSFGGIAERLKAEMLYKLGGVHIDLDVTFLKPFNYDSEYVFRPHPQGVVGNVIKAPKGSKMALKYINWVKKIDENNTDWEKSFRGLNSIVKELNLTQFIAPMCELGVDLPQFWWDFIKTVKRPSESLKLVHFCGALQEYKNYIEGSFYEELLKKYGIK